MSRSEASPFNCVVDASVGIKLCVTEPLSEEADALFAHLSDTPPAHLYVPDLFFIECANVLWKYVQRFAYSPEVALQNVLDLTHLPLHVAPVQSLTEVALALAMGQHITAYDAAYVALAQRLSLPMITADETLVRCLKSTGLDVRLLGG